MSEAPRKFSFDTVFDAAGEVAYAPARPKRSYTAEEVEEIRGRAYAEAEAATLDSVAARQQQALAQIATACTLALPKLAEVAHKHRVAAAELALACAKGIAGAALERFPATPLEAALAALSQEIEAAPRLVVTVEGELAEELGRVLEESPQTAGYAGLIQVRADASLGPHAFTLDFGDGHAVFDPQAAAQRVGAALEAALAAEGLHAEPLIPGAQSEPES